MLGPLQERSYFRLPPSVTDETSLSLQHREGPEGRSDSVWTWDELRVYDSVVRKRGSCSGDSV